MHEGALGVHEIEFMIETRPGFGNGCRVGEHADGTWHLRNITTRHNRWWLVVYANLKKKPISISSNVRLEICIEFIINVHQI